MNPKKIELKDWLKYLFNINKCFKVTPEILTKFIFLLKECDSNDFNGLIDRIDVLSHFILCRSYYFESYIQNVTVHLNKFEKHINVLIRKIFGLVFMCISNEHLIYNNEKTIYQYLNTLKKISNYELNEFANLINKYTLFDSLEPQKLKVIIQSENNGESMIGYLLNCNIHDYDEYIEKSSNYIKYIQLYKMQNPYLEVINQSHKRKLCDDIDQDDIEIQDPLKTLKEIESENNIVLIGTSYYYIDKK